MTPARPGRPDDTAAPDDRVHQIVFRWAGNVGHRGAGIAAVAHSCPEPEARALADRLGPVLRVMGGEQRPSVVRHILPGGRVLLVRRTPGSDAQGRDSTVCHALLGPANYLVPLYCVSLGAAPWAAPGWADQVTGEIEPVSRDRLKALATDMRDRMWENVPLVRRPLVCLVAQFLRTPGARLSALAGELDESLTEAYARAREHRTVPPPEELPEPALLVLWGLWCVFGPSLDREREAASWQFATFDTRDDQPYRVVFVPAWRVSPRRTAAAPDRSAGPRHGPRRRTRHHARGPLPGPAVRRAVPAAAGHRPELGRPETPALPRPAPGGVARQVRRGAGHGHGFRSRGRPGPGPVSRSVACPGSGLRSVRSGPRTRPGPRSARPATAAAAAGRPGVAHPAVLAGPRLRRGQDLFAGVGATAGRASAVGRPAAGSGGEADDGAAPGAGRPGDIGYRADAGRLGGTGAARSRRTVRSRHPPWAPRAAGRSLPVSAPAECAP